MDQDISRLKLLNLFRLYLVTGDTHSKVKTFILFHSSEIEILPFKNLNSKCIYFHKHLSLYKTLHVIKYRQYRYIVNFTTYILNTFLTFLT
jgi:hypothetical protein